MYRVVIVDDEPMIRKGLRETIEWDSLDLEICGEASNGMEALELVKANKPHILITDIKMPEMDGIELIREIKTLDLNPKIIILSGYSDYAFLKEAIRHGVESYLLKPIDHDELISNLTDSVNNIEEEIFRVTQLHQGIELLRSNTLNRLVANAISQNEFDEKAAFLDISFQGNHYLCAVCARESLGDGTSNHEKPDVLLRIHHICEELVANAGVAFVDTKGRIVYLLSGEDAGQLCVSANILLKNAADRIGEHLRISILVGAGITVSAIRDVWKSYDSAVRCVEYGRCAKTNGIVWHDEVDLDGLKANCVPGDQMFVEAGNPLGTGSAIVKYAVSYIAEHYHEGLTLKQVASACHINTSYLGQIFKKEMGESFTDYTNKYRIQEAKKMLTNSNLKVYKIGENVGFADYHYFLKIFKKIAGVNPTEIRR